MAALATLLTGCGGSDDGADFLDDIVADATLSESETAEPASWGEQAWPNGITIRVSAPQPCEPGPNADPSGIERAEKLTLTLTNEGQHPHELGTYLLIRQATIDGAEVDSISDLDGACDSEELYAGVEAGGSTDVSVAYPVPPEGGELTLEIAPGLDQEPHEFTGNV